MEVEMYHIDYSLVMIKHAAQEKQITYDLEQQSLARLPLKVSRNLPERAVKKLGDDLIHWGEKLKDGNSSSPNPMLPTFDCD